jgi:hypothetical protein
VCSSDLQDFLIARSHELGVNLIMATPPCQGMSTAGRQEKDDEMKNQVSQITAILKAFTQNTSLQANLATNLSLVSNMNDIKNKAQSGELLNSYQAPPETGPSAVTYNISPKFNAWDAYKRDHPEDADEFAKSSPTWMVPILDWIHDISTNMHP